MRPPTQATSQTAIRLGRRCRPGAMGCLLRRRRSRRSPTRRSRIRRSKFRFPVILIGNDGDIAAAHAIEFVHAQLADFVVHVALLFNEEGEFPPSTPQEY